jgi:hypothetical protein
LKFGLDASPPDGQAAFSDAGEGEAPTESFHGGQKSAKHHTAAEDLPQPGDRFGSYQLTRVLGRGGMGMVYEAEDTATSRRVALKLLTHGWDSPEARNRFFREGRLAASINHPHSVYIYGTEEIDGTPAISMEHIAGGTLQERVREHGPLSPPEAVDAILDIIAGLEAAATVGVLHRDVKPSNCFIDAEGTVKIGDFGLSISTTSHSDSYLTVPGAYLGTPAFSSPEQMRGDVLDVRSDIYAVGVTLFYLLTGRTPFEGENLVRLLATVLEQPAPSPANFRERLPRGLCKVVLRCLAKQPGDRYRDYSQLRDALRPYDSTTPSAATLALRFAAGTCDYVCLTIINAVICLSIWGWAVLAQNNMSGALTALVLSLQLLYFAMPEYLWGTTPGKALLGLRLVLGERGRLGLSRILARTGIFLTLPNAINWIYWLAMGGELPETIAGSFGLAAVGLSYWVILVAMFCTARRQNGFAALHDLAVGARVVRGKARLDLPGVSVEPLSLPEKTPGTKVGPYHILDTLRGSAGDELLLGYDPRLLRRVWIHRSEPSALPVSNHRRSVSRIGRLRWLSGQRSADEAWDAYDAFGGRSFLDIVQQPQSWGAVRGWLLELATELAAAQKDATLPSELRLDHLWITTDGRVKLLDFTAPMADGASLKPEEPPESVANAGRFLRRAAVIALHGRSSSADSPQLEDVAIRLPLSAGNLLARLEKTDLPEMTRELSRCMQSAARITPRRRAGVYAAMMAFPLLMAGLSLLGSIIMSTLASSRSDLEDLRLVLSFKRIRHMSQPQGSAEDGDLTEAAWELYIAERFRTVIEDEQAWQEPLAMMIAPQDRKFAKRAVERHPNPSAQEFESAAAIVEPVLNPLLEAQRQIGKNMQLPQIAWIALMQFTSIWTMFVSIPALAAALFVRRGLVARAFGIEYLTSKGRPASRFRLLWRAILTQAPMPVLAVLVMLTSMGIKAAVLPAIAIVTIAALFMVLPYKSRSLADRLAFTYPVPA